MHEHLTYYMHRVPGLKQRGAEYRAPCPVHHGERESFAVNPETGQWHCHSECDKGGDAIRLEERLTGCSFIQAKRAVEEICGGTTAIAVNDSPRPPKKNNEKVVQLRGKIVATYDYLDAEGTLVYQIVRYDPKDFRQRRPDPDHPDQWVWSIKGIDRLLYRLPEILKSSGPIWYVEGEKDVENGFKRLGLNTTTSSGGAGKFTAQQARCIAGRDVFIIQDNDAPNPKTGRHEGAEHAKKVSQFCRLEGCICRIISLPGAKDLTEWIAAGGTREQLLALAEAAPVDGEGAIAEPRESENSDGLPANVVEMLRNYTILVGSNMIWDSRRSTTTTPDQVRLSHALDYSAWIKHPEARKVDVEKLVFKPQGAKDGELNIFTGVKMQPKKGECGLIIDHLQLLCSSDADLFHWMLAWLAYPLQNIGAKMMTSVVLHGAQGCGKNIFFVDVMAAIYGEYSRCIEQTQIESTYTGWASHMLFVVADEVISRAERAQMKNRIKSLVTGETISIEEKYQAMRSEENHMNLVFLSNEDVPVFIEKGDRRFTVINFSEVYKPEYYANLASQIKNGGVESFYAYLLNYNVGAFNPHTKPYETKAKGEIVKSCVNPAERFLDEWEAGELPVPFGCCTASDLFAAYKVWAVVSGEKFGGTQTAFGRVAGKRFKKVASRLFDNGGSLSQVSKVYMPDGSPSARDADAFKTALDEWLKREQRNKL